MFGKKKHKKEKDEELHVDVQTMPGIFYGGNDPEIYHTQGIPAGDPNVGSMTKKRNPLPKRYLQHIQNEKKYLLW